MIYKISLILKSGLATPFHADTIFGHLCWVIAHQDGEKALERFLEPFIEGEPPFILSDGFPEGFFPRPLSAEFNTEDPEERKDIARCEWVDYDSFNLIREGKSFKLKEKGPDFTILTSSHNIINRFTNASLSKNGVYSFKEIRMPKISILFMADSDEWKVRLEELFNILSRSGFGKKKSIGKGQFSVEKPEEVKFPGINNADGFVALSNFCPAEDDPVEGLYKIFVKYGKLGEEFTFSGNPFKKPLIMIKTGSVFKIDKGYKGHCGRMAGGISETIKEAVQYAYTFTLPIKYPDI